MITPKNVQLNVQLKLLEGTDAIAHSNHVLKIVWVKHSMDQISMLRTILTSRPHAQIAQTKKKFKF